MLREREGMTKRKSGEETMDTSVWDAFFVLSPTSVWDPITLSLYGAPCTHSNDQYLTPYGSIWIDN